MKAYITVLMYLFKQECEQQIGMETQVTHVILYNKTCNVQQFTM